MVQETVYSSTIYTRCAHLSKFSTSELCGVGSQLPMIYIYIYIYIHTHTHTHTHTNIFTDVYYASNNCRLGGKILRKSTLSYLITTDINI